MFTTTKRTTDETLADHHGWALCEWEAIDEAACDSVLNEMLVGVDPDDDDLRDQITHSVSDAVANAWQEGMSHDEWVSAALRILQRNA